MSKKFNDPKGAIGATKTPLGLIPPHAMEQTAWVHKLGADKYGAWNWRETGVCASTYVNAILRHLNAWRDGEDLDPESGISHLAHIACSANILMDAEYCNKLQDDRNTTRQCNEVEESDGDWDWLFDEEEDDGLWTELDESIKEDWAEAGYRLLNSGELLKDGDEVYVGFGDWMTLYIPHWIKQEGCTAGSAKTVTSNIKTRTTHEPRPTNEDHCGDPTRRKQAGVLAAARPTA